MKHKDSNNRKKVERNSLFQRYWAPLICAALVLVFYWDVLVASTDQIVAGNDLANMFRIWLDYARSTVFSGHFPLWNPYLFSGVSFVSDPQPALFYPPTWLSLLIPTNKALGLILIIHIWWAMVGMIGFLRSMSISQSGALLGAVIFGFSGFSFARVQAGHLGVITTSAWLPWGLWAIHTLAERNSQRRRAFGALVFAMSILAGHTATTIYLGVMWAVYATYCSVAHEPNRRKKFFQSLMIVGVWGIGVSAIQLFPLLQQMLSSTRLGGADYTFASRFSWPVGYLLSLLIPNFFGEPVHTGYWGEGVYDELIFYVGILPLLLAWIGSKMRSGRFWMAVCIGSLLVAFGEYGIIHRLLFRFLPFFSVMRAPARIGMLFVLGIAVLAAFTLTRLEKAEEQERKQLLDIFYNRRMTGLLLAAGFVVTICYLLYAWGRESNSEAGRMWHIAGQVATFGLFLALSLIVGRAWSKKTIASWMPAITIGLVLLDLWTLGANLVEMEPAPLNAYWRIVSSQVASSDDRVLPWGLSIFEQNAALDFQIKSVFGYNPLEDKEYNELISSISDPRAHVYDLLGAKYVSTTSPFDLDQDDTLSLLSEKKGVFLYERSTAMPRAWLAGAVQTISKSEVTDAINDPFFNPREKALVMDQIDCDGDGRGVISVADDGPNILVAEIEGDGGLAVFSERYAAGWLAYLDGEPVKVHRVDAILRGVCVPPGTHTLVFFYRPIIVYCGAALTFLSLSLVFLFLARPGGLKQESHS